MTELVQNVLTSVENLCQHMDILLLENKKMSSYNDDDADMLPYVIRACTTLQDKLRLYRLRTTQITNHPLNSKQEKKLRKRPHLQLLPQDILYYIFSWCDAAALTVARISCKSFSYTQFSSSLPLVDAVAKSICKSKYRFSDTNTLPPRSWELWTQVLGMLELQRSCIKRSRRIAFENGRLSIIRNGEVYCEKFEGFPADDDFFFKPRSCFTKIHITQVALGFNHGLFLSDQGIVYSAGCNKYGELGRPDVVEDCTDIPAAILIPDKISNIGTGFEHSICITTDGEIWTFGQSNFGQCGHGDRIDTRVPIKVKIAEEKNPPPFFVQCSGGYSHSYFLTNDGRVFGCGLSISINLLYATRPIEMSTNGLQHRVVQVLAADCELYYLTLEGSVYYSIHKKYPSKEEVVVPKFLTKSQSSCKVIQIFAGFKSPRFLLSDGSLARCSRDNYGKIDGNLKLEQKFETVEGMAMFNFSSDYVSYIIESTKKGEVLHRHKYNLPVDGSFISEQRPLKFVTNSSE